MGPAHRHIMAEIRNESDAGSAMTAIIAILVIVVIGLALYFGFRGRNAAVPNTGVDVQLNNPSGTTGNNPSGNTSNPSGTGSTNSSGGSSDNGGSSSTVIPSTTY